MCIWCLYIIYNIYDLLIHIYIYVCVCNMLLYIYNRVEFKCTSKYDYMKLCINIVIIIYIYTWTVLEPHNFRSLWIFGWGLKITFGLRVMDSMTQFWCQKVGLSHHFASYFWSFQMWLTEGKNKQLFDFWSLTTFQSRPKKDAAFGCPGMHCIHMLHLP